MHAELIAKAIRGVCSPYIDLDEFMVKSRFHSKSVAKDVIRYLNHIGIGSCSRGVITFSRSDRLKTAIVAFEIGSDIERISSGLSWRDFEALTLEILRNFGYKAEVNVRFTKPRCEIDVIGISSTCAIVIDCKHWKRSNLSLVSSYAKKQVSRTQQLIKRRTKSISFAIPAILTLHSENVHFINRVPIIPINKFTSFLHNFQCNYQEMHLMYPETENDTVVCS
jgi:Nuclease-related domain